MVKRKLLETSFAGLKLGNPVFLASGIAGFGEEYSGMTDLNLLGGFITKTVTLRPRAGNKPPRIAETPSGMINSIGLENPGLDVFIEKKLPFLRTALKIPLVVSIGGDSIPEYAELAVSLSGEEGVRALELNISCPNVKSGLQLLGGTPSAASSLIKKVRGRTKLPLIIKLSPNVRDISEMACACQEAGADALALTNTYKALAFISSDIAGAPRKILGGLSGSAVKPMVLRSIWEVYEKVRIPIMGSGGITGIQDALEHIAAGASAVALGSAFFSDPCSAGRIISGLKEYLEKNNIDLDKLVGIAHGRS